ncbi:MAG: type II toxin-antitoxin system VapC family toxin [Anaerolineae bacterium]|nr:type II toxin-antitoxin system VapC family toxin [Anaerolineae bacterium]
MTDASVLASFALQDDNAGAATCFLKQALAQGWTLLVLDCLFYKVIGALRKLEAAQQVRGDEQCSSFLLRLPVELASCRDLAVAALNAARRYTLSAYGCACRATGWHAGDGRLAPGARVGATAPAGAGHHKLGMSGRGFCSSSRCLDQCRQVSLRLIETRLHGVRSPLLSAYHTVATICAKGRCAVGVQCFAEDKCSNKRFQEVHPQPFQPNASPATPGREVTCRLVKHT